MDLQAIMDTISETARSTRKDYHLTLEGLIEIIRSLENQDLTVVLDYDGTISVGSLDSYRGYYADLALEPSLTPIPAKKLLIILLSAWGSTFEGYKGGDFKMEGDTPLWVAAYGNTGRALMDAVVLGEHLVLITKDIG